LLVEDPPIDLNDRRWVIHTRTESRPPAWLSMGAQVGDSLISHGCVIERGARVEHSVLSPGVIIRSGVTVYNSIILNDTVVDRNSAIYNAVLDKDVRVGENSSVGEPGDGSKPILALVGKKSILPPGTLLKSGGLIGTDVIASDYESNVVASGESVISQRKPYDI
jgi:glucose-1-phosphate adenylyltransferase